MQDDRGEKTGREVGREAPVRAIDHAPRCSAKKAAVRSSACLRGFFVATLAEFGGETVVEPFVVVQRHLGMVVETLVHRLLHLGRNEAVGGGDMEHQRVGDGVFLSQQAVDPDRVIADAGIGVGSCRGHVREPAAEAVAHRADLAAAFL